MATEFEVIFLGTAPIMDTVEGNRVSENYAALEGMTFGSASDPLKDHVQTFAPGTGGFSGGASSSSYELDQNSASENFTINGGPDQVYDSGMMFNATITYMDGTTDIITAGIIQDTVGNTYLVPETSYNADQIALELKPIKTLELGSAIPADDDKGYNLSADRYDANFACFVKGTRLLTPSGEVRIETLQVGDEVCLYGGGAKPILWIEGRHVTAGGKRTPVLIAAGALGGGLPLRDLRVSRQHRMLIRSKVAKRMFGTSEVFLPAIKLIGLPGIKLDQSAASVVFFHLMFDRHEVVIADGAPSESLHIGPEACKMLPKDALDEIMMLFPHLFSDPNAKDLLARPVPTSRKQHRLLERHKANRIPLLQTPEKVSPFALAGRMSG